MSETSIKVIRRQAGDRRGDVVTIRIGPPHGSSLIALSLEDAVELRNSLNDAVSGCDDDAEHADELIAERVKALEELGLALSKRTHILTAAAGALKACVDRHDRRAIATSRALEEIDERLDALESAHQEEA